MTVTVGATTKSHTGRRRNDPRDTPGATRTIKRMATAVDSSGFPSGMPDPGFDPDRNLLDLLGPAPTVTPTTNKPLGGAMSTITIEDRRMAAKVQETAASNGSLIAALHEQATASNEDVMSLFATCARVVADEIRARRLEPRPAKN